MCFGLSARIRWPTTALASTSAFLVVQDMFLTETAKRADVVFPAASAYEKDGTVTNVTGEVQRLKRAAKTMGAKPDLEIFGLIAKDMGVQRVLWPRSRTWCSKRSATMCAGTMSRLPVLTTGGAAQTMPVNGRVPVASRPDLVRSAIATRCLRRGRSAAIRISLTP